MTSNRTWSPLSLFAGLIRTDTREGVELEPEDFLYSVGMQDGGTAASATGTSRGRRAKKDREAYEILKQAQKKSWTPSAEVKAFIPITAGETDRQIGGQQAAAMGKFGVLSDEQKDELGAVAPMMDCLPLAVVRPPVLDELASKEGVVSKDKVDALENRNRKRQVGELFFL